ncbi:MAG TPA: FAD-dependent oxidoreductase, partial [Steroidobacteraceae bacterium]|nr:FAD-dependent oxidoreductase [Steroidobacteraceae bacterium]
MSATRPGGREVRVPPLGDFKDVPVIAVLVAPGQPVGENDPLVTLESDKATMDVPAPFAGTVLEVLVKVGDRIAEGTLLAIVADSAAAATAAQSSGDTVRISLREDARTGVSVAAGAEPAADIVLPLVVLGAGPGGYTAAFRAADLGMKVGLIDRRPTLGGVCLNVGCIPSKALLHAAKVIDDAASMANFGVAFGAPQIDLARLSAWKRRIVSRLTSGLTSLAKQRKVEVLCGEGRFVSPHRIAVTGESGTKIVGFEQCIVAAGSEPIGLAGVQADPRIMDSTAALELDGLPQRLLVIGGGIIGLEMACVYAALGSRVTVVELLPGLMPGCDRDLVRPLEKRLRGAYEAIYLGNRVTGVEALATALRVTFEGTAAAAPQD